MSVTFRTATQVRALAGAEGEYEALIPDGWQQGRGAFGGVVFGVLLRAARAHERDQQRVARSFACDVAGPVMTGTASVKVRELRRGRSQTNLQLELSQQGSVLASAICTLSGERTGSAPSLAPSLPPEASLPYEDALVVPPIAGGPVFGQHYEYRNLGPIPFRGGQEAIATGFVRERADDAEYDPPALSALLDSFWPAIYAVSSKPYAMTTVSYNAQFLPGPIAPVGDPLFYRARALTQQGGYSVEFRELWSRDRLLALNQQTFAVLG
jgi:hypothetical protein